METVFVSTEDILKEISEGRYPIFDIREVNLNYTVTCADARGIDVDADIWITDPPFAGAVNYAELSEFYLTWSRPALKKCFPDWQMDNIREKSVNGDESFVPKMIEIYSNMTAHMPDYGIQVMMFAHSDPVVWAQLALIIWHSGLMATAAWNIETEAKPGGIKKGKHINCTMLIILRKRIGLERTTLSEIESNIADETANQLEYMLCDEEDNIFSYPDYSHAAYAACMIALTGHNGIFGLDLDDELNKVIHKPKESKFVEIVKRTKKMVYDHIDAK